ncbi:MAG: DUF711 family protein, partial [Deltaproteobacteria bacterium]|nr:DUF711 family protein [Deltaproteobacteria bacterium]
MLKFSHEEILETVEMIEALHLDIRTVTMGISLIDCIHPDPKIMGEKIFKKIKKFASSFVKEKKNIEEKYGIPIVNTRISVTPIGSIMINPKEDDFLYIANILDEVAEAISVDFLGGFSALVHKGATLGERLMISSIPDVLSSTKRVCSSVNVASTKAG